MATMKELETALINAHGAGDTQAATIIAKAIVEARKTTAPAPKFDPTEGTSFGQRMLEGIGQGMMDIPYGIGQRLGLVSQEQADERARLDAPLKETGGGMVGNVVGKVASAVPAAFIPGANTLVGAGAIGAGMGAIEPTKSGESVGKNMAYGAAFNAIAPAAAATWKAGKALIDPLHSAGQNRIMADTINRFATDPQKAAGALRNPEQFVPGVKPTAAEASLDPGIAVLQRSAMSADPQMAGAFATREAENSAARLAALRGVAGDADQMAFHQAARNATAQELYGKAFAETPADTKWIKGEITKLMQRPSFVSALKEAQSIALDEGIKISPKNPENATQVLHYTKLALDSRIGAAVQRGESPHGLIATRDKVVSLMESKDFSPSYREARDTYKQMSKPINQMEVGQALYNKMQPALSDFAGDASTLPRVRAEAYAQALRDGDRTAQRATGFSGAKMESVMSPEQMQTLTGIAKDLSRRATAQEIGKVSGSPTAQYLSSQNLMRQVAGPLGMPQNWVESGLMQSLARPIDFVAKRSDAMIQKKLAETLMDPKLTADALQKALKKNPEQLGLLSRYLLPVIPVTSGAGLLSYSSQQ